MKKNVLGLDVIVSLGEAGAGRGGDHKGCGRRQKKMGLGGHCHHRAKQGWGSLSITKVENK